MEINADGLVFVDLSYDGGAMESLNIASISRLRQMSEKWCEERDRKFPTLCISIVGMENDLVVGNLGMKEFKDRIKKSIKDHYTDILEKELLS